MGSSIRNVIFDMGGVLMRFDGRFFASFYASGEADARAISEALFESSSWPLLDAGVIDEDTMERVAAAALPERLHAPLHECFMHWHEHSDPYPEANELALRLKREGYGIYLLSNAGKRFTEQSRRMTAFPYMDGWLVSAWERIMKPDPAIYQLICERYALDPAMCLFVDDNANNVEGARLAGMQGFHYEGDAAALERAILG
jgi:HAD superfamily hydrolase (TIGR01509 family)